MEKQSWPLFDIGDYPDQYRIELIERIGGVKIPFGLRPTSPADCTS